MDYSTCATHSSGSLVFFLPICFIWLSYLLPFERRWLKLNSWNSSCARHKITTLYTETLYLCPYTDESLFDIFLLTSMFYVGICIYALCLHDPPPQWVLLVEYKLTILVHLLYLYSTLNKLHSSYLTTML